MGRHTASQGEAFEFEFDLTKAPAPGSRRAARLAERSAESRTAFGQPRLRAEEAPLQAFIDEDQTADAIPVYPGEPAERGDVPDEVLDAKRGRFALFRRSRAAVAAVVAAASGVGTVVVSTLTQPGTAEARTLTANAESEDVGAAQVAPVTFTVKVDGQTRSVTSNKPTLHEALNEAGIAVDGDDQVSQAMGSPVSEGAEVVVTRVDSKTMSVDVNIPHQTSEVQDSTLPKGSRVVEKQGQDGVAANTYQVAYVDGKEYGRNLVVAANKKEVVNEVVRVGTGEASATPSNPGSNQNQSGSTAKPSQESSQSAPTATPTGDPQQIAHAMLSSYGWGDSQFSCLVSLWEKESNWNHRAMNKSSGAYGIPQSLPGSKMASAGADWQTNPATQIRWGLGYIQGRYGSPCAAWGHSQAKGWY